MSAPDLCIHHHPCADGFTAAWAIHSRWPDIEFLPGVYGQFPPNVLGKRVLIVDFSYRREMLETMAKSAEWVIVLDHHKSAEADLAPYTGGSFDSTGPEQDAYQRKGAGGLPIAARFDMAKSGARMAWEYAQPNREAPLIVKYVEDRDLWRFTLPGTREIAAELFSRPYDFAEWDKVAERLETESGLREIIEAGAAIERKHHKDVGELLKLCTRRMVIGGQEVAVANIPYTLSSDAANALAEGSAFGACYYDNAEGKRVFSLRSKDGGADVSAIAFKYGGGGHERAAGFTAPPGWEGDL